MTLIRLYNGVHERFGLDPIDKERCCLILDKSGNLDMLHHVGMGKKKEESFLCMSGKWKQSSCCHKAVLFHNSLSSSILAEMLIFSQEDVKHSIVGWCDHQLQQCFLLYSRLFQAGAQ